MDVRKTILFYISSLEKGGAERVFVNLAEYFFSEGYNVKMVTTYHRDEEYSLNPNIERYYSEITPDEETGSRVGNLKARIKKLHDIFAEINPDLVMTCNGKTNMMAIAAAKGLKAKVVISVIADPLMEYYTKLMRIISKTYFIKADGIIVQTKEAAEYFPKRIRNKCKLLPNSLNPAFMLPRYDGENGFEIVTVGRLDENKNQALLINAFLPLKDKYPNYKIMIYGDGVMKSRLAKMIEDNGLVGRVFLKGQVSNVSDTIRNASLFVLTSNTEGMPNALIEAMALGLPVISTDCPSGGPRHLIKDGVNGLLVSPGNVEALIEALDRVLSNDEYRESLGKEAYKLQEELSPSKVNLQWKEYFESVMQG